MDYIFIIVRNCSGVLYRIYNIRHDELDDFINVLEDLYGCYHEISDHRVVVWIDLRSWKKLWRTFLNIRKK